MAGAGDPMSRPGGLVASGYSTTAEIRHVTIPASAAETAEMLRGLADRLDREPETVLIGMWNTGFGEPWEFTFQVVLSDESTVDDGDLCLAARLDDTPPPFLCNRRKGHQGRHKVGDSEW